MLCWLRVHGELGVRAKGCCCARVLALLPLMMATGKEIWQLTPLRP